MMRIVWKDTGVAKVDMKYRGYMLTPYKQGWTINVPGDDNIYGTNKSARNAIDKHLGIYDINNEDPKRHRLGIKIIGKIDEQRLG